MYILYIHTWMYSTLANAQHAHIYLKGTCIQTCTNARARTLIPTCTQGLGGTQARIVRVQKSYSVGNKFTHQNILLGSLHNSSSRLQRGAWRGLVGWFVAVMTFRTLSNRMVKMTVGWWYNDIRWPGLSDEWGVREEDVLCEHASECFKCSPHTSFMFSSLNNKQKKSNSLYLYFWNHSPHLSPFKIYNIYHIRVYKI